MGKKKLFLMALLMLVMLVSIAFGLFWQLRHYVLVDFQLYPKASRHLDLRDQEITLRHYEKLRRRFPDCEILWNVPFQDRAIAWDAKEITLSTLTEEDIQALSYLEQLERVNAESCADYDALLQLRQQRPDLQVEYSVRIGSERYCAEAEQILLTEILPEEISSLAYLPNLKQVVCGGGETEAVSRLMTYCQEHQLDFSLSLGDAVVPLDAKSVTAGAITDAQLGLPELLTDLQQLHIRMPQASARKLLELQERLPNAVITWEQALCGQVFSSTAEEIDLSGGEITDLEALDQEMAYFPNAKLVFLGDCGLDNELLAAHRAQVRDRYKLVWTVSCGKKLKTRTDATTFMPVRERVYYFNDEEAYNLRYCEDMVCIDIGHMSIHNIDFVTYMPNLEYLILAHTQLQDIEPIRNCKKLKFLELDWSPVRDLTPLQGCTALEDLNLGKVYADFAPVEEMTWLKNLWMVGCSSGARYRMTQALPDTKVMVTGDATVANGWRNLDNYYKMRDLLGMYYMSW